MYKTLIV